MKEFLITDSDSGEYSNLYVGSTEEIKAIYKSIVRAGNKTDVYPLFTDSPIFSENKTVYGLEIEQDNSMTILNSDTVLSILLKINVCGYEIEEVRKNSLKSVARDSNAEMDNKSYLKLHSNLGRSR